MLLPLSRPNGLKQRLTPTTSVALIADPAVWRRKRFGSIADRQFIQKTIEKNGRNFTNVIAAMFGGLGVPNVRPLNLLVVKILPRICNG